MQAWWWGVSRQRVLSPAPRPWQGQGGGVGAHQQVDRLYDVDEDLILLVLDALGAPGHSIGDSGRHPRLACLQLVALLCDVPGRTAWSINRWTQGHFPGHRQLPSTMTCPVAAPMAHSLLQNLAVCGLGEAEVHELIQ